MKKWPILLALIAPLGAQALEQARVISSTPIVTQSNVPTQVCGNTPVAVEQPKSGAGAALGAIAGGVVGNAVGKGSGNALATMAGIVGGAVLGDSIEGRQTSIQNIQTCTTQMVVQSKTTYNVIYEYAGKQYTVQMPTDPGPFVNIQISPVDTAPPPPAPQPTAQAIIQPMPQPVYVAPYPVVYPPPYPHYIYPPFSLGFGYYSGPHRHH